VSEPQPASRALRIAAHISASEWGGAERRSLALLAALTARGHSVIIYCNTEFIAERAAERGLHAIVAPLRGDVMVHRAFALAALLRSTRPDVLLLVTFRRLLTGALAGRLARVPRIVARIGLASDVARSAKYRFVLKRWIDDVVVNAHSLAAPFSASLAPGSRVRVTAIPNGVPAPVHSVSRADARAALRLPAEVPVIGTVARIVSQKRIDRIVRIVHALRDRDVHAVIAGSGRERAAVEQLAILLGVGDRVHFTGHLDDVSAVHRALDVYVVTSSQEGMSSAMLEALAAGVPVISTPVSGAVDVLDGPPPCGVIVRGDDADMAAAVRALLDDPDRRAAMGRAGAATIAAHYGTDGMVDRWERLLLG
jgi:glycosyltransferase involved in cell wall biosynthesis